MHSTAAAPRYRVLWYTLPPSGGENQCYRIGSLECQFKSDEAVGRSRRLGRDPFHKKSSSWRTVRVSCFNWVYVWGVTVTRM